MAGSATPARLKEPGLSRDDEPQRPICSMPGDSEGEAGRADQHVEVEVLLARLDLVAVERADGDVDAEHLQRALVDDGEPLLGLR